MNNFLRALLRNLIFFVRYVSLEKIEAQGGFNLYYCALYGTQRVLMPAA